MAGAATELLKGYFMADNEAGSSKVQDEFGVSCSMKIRESAKNTKG